MRTALLLVNILNVVIPKKHKNEECDDGDINNNDKKDCHGNCKRNRCGDGKKHKDEECDDGNDDDGDGCSSKCQYECRFDGDNISNFLVNADGSVVSSTSTPTTSAKPTGLKLDSLVSSKVEGTSFPLWAVAAISAVAGALLMAVIMTIVRKIMSKEDTQSKDSFAKKAHAQLDSSTGSATPNLRRMA